MTPSIFAGIVSYNPEIDRLKEDIDAIYLQVDHVYVADNCSDNISAVDELCNSYGNVEIIHLDKNYGLAKALNTIFERSEASGAEWVLTLDQDSVANSDLIDIYKPYISDKKYNSLCTFWRIRALGGKSTGRSDGTIDGNIVKTDKCITSGNLVRVSAWRKIGGYKEEFFTDMVDYELCYKLRANNMDIYRINKVGFLHDLGAATERRFLTRKVYVFNHSAFRKYYVAKNTVYLLRFYPKAKSDGNLYSLIKLIIYTVLYETGKAEKLKSLFKGIYDGLTMKK